MRTTVRLNEALARQAKRYAAKAGLTFTALVEKAITEMISKNAARGRPKRKIVLPTFGDPNHKITWEQYQQAVEEAQLEDDMRSLGFKNDPG